MKYLLATILCALAVLSVVVSALKPGAPPPGKTPLVWVSDNNPQRAPQIESFNKLYPDCLLALDPNNTGITKVIVQTCAKVGPDIIDVYGIHQLQTYVDAGVVLDVTDVAKQRGFDPSVTYPKAEGEITIDGRQYCFPCNVNTNILFLNKNLFDKYGVPYPPERPTWDELVATAAKLTIRKPGSKLPECFGMASIGWEELVYMAGGRFFNEDGTRCVVDSPEAIRAFGFYQDLMYRYKVMPTPLEQSAMSSQGGWGTGWRNWFGSQKIAMIAIGKWALITFRQFADEQRQERDQWLHDHPGQEYPDLPPLRMGAVHLPRFVDQPNRCIIAARSAAVNRLSPNADKAVNFLEYLASKEYCDTINEGADALPGNTKYATLDYMQRFAQKGEGEEINRLTLEAAQWGIVRELSPFVDGQTALRLITTQVQRLEASPDADVADVCRAAAQDVNEEMKRNVAGEVRLQMLWNRLTMKRTQAT